MGGLFGVVSKNDLARNLYFGVDSFREKTSVTEGPCTPDLYEKGDHSGRVSILHPPAESENMTGGCPVPLVGRWTGARSFA